MLSLAYPLLLKIWQFGWIPKRFFGSQQPNTNSQQFDNSGLFTVFVFAVKLQEFKFG